MKHELVNWKKMNTNAVGESVFNKYCYLVDDCYKCNPKVKVLCAMKRKIERIQEKIICSELNGRP